jgi:predicted lipid-binding transport protein (Tim44 family)
MNTRRVTLSARAFAVVAALAGTALLTADFADARGGRGGSFGSRGTRTFDPPAATRTAPNPSTVQKSITQPGRAGAAANTATQASRFGGLRGLLLGGLIGAGLVSLFGLGGGLAAFLGFALQMLLIAGLVMLAIALFRRLRGGSSQPALAQATAVSGPAAAPQNNAYRTTQGGLGGAAALPTLNIVGDDYNAFERLLKEVQLAYANSDINALGDRVTPEMLSHFARELDENKRKGLSNDLSEPKLLQGDLSEAWREHDGEYATVAMRYEIIDALVDQRSGRVVEGSTTEPQQVTEVWTFRRPVGGNAGQWELSAIQQA